MLTTVVFVAVFTLKQPIFSLWTKSDLIIFKLASLSFCCLWGNYIRWYAEAVVLTKVNENQLRMADRQRQTVRLLVFKTHLSLDKMCYVTETKLLCIFNIGFKILQCSTLFKREKCLIVVYVINLKLLESLCFLYLYVKYRK